MLQQLTEVAPATPSPGGGIERRVAERHRCEISASLQPTAAWGKKEALWPGTIQNISVGGVRCLLSRRYERGTSLAIELPGKDGRQSYTVIAQVVQVTAQTGGWSLGCKFASELTEDEIHGLLPALANRLLREPPPVAPSRSAQPVLPAALEDSPERKKITDVHFLLCDSTQTIMNCVIRCLYVSPDWPLPPGKQLKMFGDTSNGALPVMQFRVVECREVNGHWTLRCQLLRPPTAEMMEALRTVAT